MLKYTGCIKKPEGHDIELVHTIAIGKISLMMSRWVNWKLMLTVI